VRCEGTCPGSLIPSAGPAARLPPLDDPNRPSFQNRSPATCRPPLSPRRQSAHVALPQRGAAAASLPAPVKEQRWRESAAERHKSPLNRPPDIFPVPSPARPVVRPPPHRLPAAAFAANPSARRSTTATQRYPSSRCRQRTSRARRREIARLQPRVVLPQRPEKCQAHAGKYRKPAERHEVRRLYSKR